MNWKTFRVLALIGIVSTGLIALLFIKNPFGQKLVLSCYFSNGMDLREGAQVRLAGIDVGSVRSVRVRPERREAPVEVVMVLTPSYELRIPNDSVVSLATAGLLGGTYAAIDISSAVGPPIETNGILKTRPTSEISSDEILKRFNEILSDANCVLDKGKASGSSNTSAHTMKSPR